MWEQDRQLRGFSQRRRLLEELASLRQDEG